MFSSVERGKIVKTVVFHDALNYITVDGFQAPNFYQKKLQYSGDIESLTNIIERSASCRQNLEYQCNNSKLLAQPGTLIQNVIIHDYSLLLLLRSTGLDFIRIEWDFIIVM